MQKVTKHFYHYLPLIGVLGAGLAGFWLFSYDRNFQAAIAVATALGYFSWGMVHHHIHKNLHLEVVLEYLAISVLGIVIMLALLFRS